MGVSQKENLVKNQELNLRMMEITMRSMVRQMMVAKKKQIMEKHTKTITTIKNIMKTTMMTELAQQKDIRNFQETLGFQNSVRISISTLHGNSGQDSEQRVDMTEVVEVNQDDIWDEIESGEGNGDQIIITINPDPTPYNSTIQLSYTPIINPSHIKNNHTQPLQAGLAIINNNIGNIQNISQVRNPNNDNSTPTMNHPSPTNNIILTRTPFPAILTTPSIHQRLQQDTESDDDYIEEEPLSFTEGIDWLGERSRNWVHEIKETQNININLLHLEEMCMNYAMQQSWDEETQASNELPEINTTNIKRKTYHKEWAYISNPIKDMAMTFKNRSQMKSEIIYDALMLMVGRTDMQESGDFWDETGQRSDSSGNSDISTDIDETTEWFLDFENASLKIDLQILTTRFGKEYFALQRNTGLSIPNLRVGLCYKEGKIWIATSFKNKKGADFDEGKYSIIHQFSNNNRDIALWIRKAPSVPSLKAAIYISNHKIWMAVSLRTRNDCSCNFLGSIDRERMFMEGESFRFDDGNNNIFEGFEKFWTKTTNRIDGIDDEWGMCKPKGSIHIEMGRKEINGPGQMQQGGDIEITGRATGKRKRGGPDEEAAPVHDGPSRKRIKLHIKRNKKNSTCVDELHRIEELVRNFSKSGLH